MPRWIASTPLPSGDGSPATTLRMSATSVGLGQVAAPVDAGVVEVGLVGAADEVAHRRDRAVGDDLAPACCSADRAEVAGLAAEVRLRSRPRWRSESRPSRPGTLPALISFSEWSPRTQQQPDGRSRSTSPASSSSSVASTSDFTVRRERQAEQRGDVLAGALARRRCLRQRLRRRGARRGRRARASASSMLAA